MEGARGEEPVEGGCVGEDHGGGEVDEEADEHWRVVAEVVDERAHERVHEQLDEGLGGEEEADRDVVAVVLEAHVGVYHCPLGWSVLTIKKGERDQVSFVKFLNVFKNWYTLIIIISIREIIMHPNLIICHLI